MENEGIQFYRCTLCGTAVSPWDIQEKRGCPKCSNNKIKPSDLSLWEKAVQIVKHPRVWRWGNAAL